VGRNNLFVDNRSDDSGFIWNFIIAFGLDDVMDHFTAYLYLKFSLKVKLEYEEIKKLIKHR